MPGTDGDGEDDRIALEAVADLAESAVEVGPDAVHLVDEAEPGDLKLVGLSPDGFALGLDAFDGAEDDDGSVEDPQAALDFGGEVDVPGGVDNVDRAIFPVAGHCR